MKRINIRYGSEQYSVAGRDLDDLQAEIAAGIDSGRTFWLEVNDGSGVAQAAMLALTPGTAISLTPIPEPDPDSDSEGTIESSTLESVPIAT